ncbi:TPA: hypothetical protein ACP40X_005281, partial [Escherichia coli]
KENYLGTGKFFVSGIAVTDTPASINTTRLQFSQGDSIHMGNAEELNFTLQSDDEQAKRSFFSGLFSVGRNKRKRLARTVLIFTEKSDQLSRATDRVPGLPASPGYAQ